MKTDPVVSPIQNTYTFGARKTRLLSICMIKHPNKQGSRTCNLDNDQFGLTALSLTNRKVVGINKVCNERWRKHTDFHCMGVERINKGMIVSPFERSHFIQLIMMTYSLRSYGNKSSCADVTITYDSFLFRYFELLHETR